ncbi:MAG: hypothetical protein U5R06_21030 [candidate division KSB1 bacterium]|nr:hypothetical protein [candidate division KSB1 bacterium]
MLMQRGIDVSCIETQVSGQRFADSENTPVLHGFRTILQGDRRQRRGAVGTRRQDRLGIDERRESIKVAVWLQKKENNKKNKHKSGKRFINGAKILNSCCEWL